MSPDNPLDLEPWQLTPGFDVPEPYPDEFARVDGVGIRPVPAANHARSQPRRASTDEASREQEPATIQGRPARAPQARTPGPSSSEAFQLVETTPSSRRRPK
jgi:hypothetical protein